MKGASNNMKPRIVCVLLASASVGLTLAVGPAAVAAEVITYPAPAGEPLSADYQVTADGQKVDVYTARVLDPPSAGKEWDYGGPYSFANFDLAGRVEVRSTCEQDRLP
jgi:Ni/Co efflux regulator RcnB